MTIQVWTAKMPRQPAVRAANTTIRACGSLAASGRMPALDHRAVCQCRGSSNDHSMALIATGTRKTTDNVRLILRPGFRMGLGNLGGSFPRYTAGAGAAGIATAVPPERVRIAR